MVVMAVRGAVAGGFGEDVWSELVDCRALKVKV